MQCPAFESSDGRRQVLRERVSTLPNEFSTIKAREGPGNKAKWSTH